MGCRGGKEKLGNMGRNGWELRVKWNENMKDVGGCSLNYKMGIGI